MKPVSHPSLSLLLTGLVALATPSLKVQAATTTSSGYVETDLVADAAGTASNTDPHLINPWGFITGPRSMWVADNGTGLVTAYGYDGVPSTMSIKVPAPGTSTAAGTPTGLILNDTRSFTLTSGTTTAPATVLAATEDGLIVAWSNRVNSGTPMVAVDNSAAGAVYKGLAIARVPVTPTTTTTTTTNEDDDSDSDVQTVPQLYATNFHAGVIDVFDANFKFVKSFTDKTVPAGFAPFGIRTIRGKLYVTFAKQKTPDLHDDQAGAGNGYVDIFNPDGTLVKQLVAQGALNSPWGIAIAPARFGAYSHALLVGNFGDGLINAYDLKTGTLLGHLTKADGTDLVVNGLWSLNFGSDDHDRGWRFMRRMAGATREAWEGAHGEGSPLYFTSGPGSEAHGLLGVLRPVDMDVR